MLNIKSQFLHFYTCFVAFSDYLFGRYLICAFGLKLYLLVIRYKNIPTQKSQWTRAPRIEYNIENYLFTVILGKSISIPLITLKLDFNIYSVP